MTEIVSSADYWKGRAEKAEGELAKFTRCEIAKCRHPAHGEFVSFTLAVPSYHREGDMATIVNEDDQEGE